MTAASRYLYAVISSWPQDAYSIRSIRLCVPPCDSLPVLRRTSHRVPEAIGSVACVVPDFSLPPPLFGLRCPLRLRLGYPLHLYAVDLLHQRCAAHPFAITWPPRALHAVALHLSGSPVLSSRCPAVALLCPRAAAIQASWPVHAWAVTSIDLSDPRKPHACCTCRRPTPQSATHQDLFARHTQATLSTGPQ